MLNSQELLEFMGEFTLNSEEKQRVINQLSDDLTYDKTFDLVTAR